MLRSVASLALFAGGLATAHGRAVPPLDATGRALSSTPPTDLSCSWGIVSNANSLNIAYPDAFATYWTQPLSLQEDQAITIEGNFPGNRYFSFTTYTVDGNVYSTSPGSNIQDNQLSAKTGINFFLSTQPQPDATPSGTGTYFLKVVAGSSSLTQPANTNDPNSVAVLAAPYTNATVEGTTLTGWLIIRMYASFAEGADAPEGYVRTYVWCVLAPPGDKRAHIHILI
jgi:hypothetical protein